MNSLSQLTRQLNRIWSHKNLFVSAIASALFTLLLFLATALPSHAQTILFQETFEGTTVAPENANAFEFGVGIASSQPPCLTAATTVPTPPTAGSATGIPACSNATNTEGPLGAPGALRLTSSSNLNDPTGAQATFISTTGAVPSNQGLTITFDFFAYFAGNPAGDPPLPPGADGISFFLLDANEPAPTEAGGFGGSLGYANRTTVGGDVFQGIRGGYLGIGLDEFGNFSRANESRTGGFPDLRPDSIGIRGSAAPPLLPPYPYLGGTAASLGVIGGSIDVPTATARVDAQRTARISISPNAEIVVQIDLNDGSGFQTAVPTFDLRNAPGIGNEGIDNGPLPDSFRFGFASSTGGRKNIHEIRSLLITTLLPPDLNIEKIAPANLAVNNDSVYTIQVRNGTGANDNVGLTTGPITVTDVLAPGVNFVSATGGAGANAWTCSAVGQTVTCTYNGLALGPGESAPDITLTVRPTAAASSPVTNLVTVSTPGEINTANNTATTTAPLLGPVLSARKTVQDGNDNNVAEAGETLTYTIIIENTGTADSTDTTLTDVIPANTTYVPSTTRLNGTLLVDTPGDIMPFAAGGLVNSVPPDIPGVISPNQQATITFQVAVNDPVPGGVTQITNQASINSDQIAPLPPLETNIAILPTTPGPSIALVKRIVSVTRNGVVTSFNSTEGNPPEPSFVGTTAPPLSVSAGDSITYRIYYLSDGSELANGVQICDQIPASSRYSAGTLRFAAPQAPPANPNTPLINAPQTDADDADNARFVNPLTPVSSPCDILDNPNGSALTSNFNVPRTEIGFFQLSTFAN